VLPRAVCARLAVEAGAAQGWSRYVGDSGDIIAIDRFGVSAPGEAVMREYGFTVDAVCRRALAVLDAVKADAGHALARTPGQRR
jgi:transketolase